ncbi:MAG: hypothetical protein WBS24_17800 [Terriglobales bacterium]
MLVIAALIFATAVTWHWAHVQRDTRTAETIVAEYLLVAGISVLALSLLSKFRGALTAVRISRWTLDVSGSAALAVSIWLLGMRQFGGFDHSELIQAGWLQFSSLAPFKDYPCTLPPLFFIGARYAFLVFGLRWSACVLSMMVFAVASFLFLSRQLRMLGFSSSEAAGLSITAELGTTVVCSFWWYNPVTSVAAVMVFVSALVCSVRSKDWISWALLSLSFTLLVLCKPNAWPIGACVTLLVATRDASQRIRALCALVFGVTSAGLICRLHGLSPMDVLRTYSEVARTRGNPLLSIVLRDWAPVEAQILVSSALVIGCLFFAILAANKDELHKYWREYSCCVITACTALALFNMNGEIKTSDLTPLVVALAVAAFRPWSRRCFDGIGRAATVIVSVCFITLSSYWGVTRLRVRGAGERMFFENFATQTIPTGFFRGLHSGPRLPRALSQIEGVLRKYPSNKVFFGPRMEFSYAVFRREPPRGLPIWWDPGTSFALSDLPAVSHSLEVDDFDLMIFLKNDCTRMPGAALLRKLRSYDHDVEFSELDVYIRRKGPGSADTLQ